MRILILGTNRDHNLDVACHLLESSALTWDAISTFVKSTKRLGEQKVVKNVFSGKSLKGDELKQEGLIVELFAATCLEIAEVKAKVEKSAHLILLVSNPQLLEIDLRKKFDRVFLTKMPVGEKLVQYHVWYMNEKLIELKTFKAAVKNLESGQYLDLTGGAIKLETRTVVAVDLTPSPSDYVLPAPKVKVVAERQIPTNLAARQVIPVPADCIELQLKFRVVATKSAADGIKALETMLGNSMVEVMIQAAFYDKVSDLDVSVYLQVKLVRQDLFVSLLFNMLQTMKKAKLLETASINVL